MSICYLVPGFGASRLFSGVEERWLSYIDILFGRFGCMRLHSNGVLPGGDDGVQLNLSPVTPDDPTYGFVPGYYEVLYQCLNRNLPRHGYTITPFPYDWRLKVRSNANRLANKIRMEVTVSEPCAIVAHSMGGLVARVAWWDLSQTGQSNLIRRIVTLGTPHQGSYATLLEAAVAPSSTAHELWFNNNVTSFHIRFRGRFLVMTRWSEDDIANLMLTWPGFYELMPFLGGSEAPADSLRADIYDASKWREGLTPSQTWLSYAKDNWQPFMLSAATLPPPNVLVCAIGGGYSTRHYLLTSPGIAHDNDIGSVPQGDDVVSQSSATLSGYMTHYLLAKHGDLPTASTYGDKIIKWILDEPPLPAPLPPSSPPTGTIAFNPTVPWPPKYDISTVPGWISRCGGGVCTC